MVPTRAERTADPFDGLEPAQRRRLAARVFGFETLSQIAEREGVSRVSVHTCLRRAYRRLRANGWDIAHPPVSRAA